MVKGPRNVVNQRALAEVSMVLERAVRIPAAQLALEHLQNGRAPKAGNRSDTLELKLGLIGLLQLLARLIQKTQLHIGIAKKRHGRVGILNRRIHVRNLGANNGLAIGALGKAPTATRNVVFCHIPDIAFTFTGWALADVLNVIGCRTAVRRPWAALTSRAGLVNTRNVKVVQSAKKRRALGKTYGRINGDRPVAICVFSQLLHQDHTLARRNHVAIVVRRVGITGNNKIIELLCGAKRTDFTHQRRTLAVAAKTTALNETILDINNHQNVGRAHFNSTPYFLF